ncbi:MAG: Fe(3+) transporter substrate-binding protein, partial [Paenibacillus sp.]|nr:Fe(3+) transporter substrate-binding protein [Paenibacillus sp.]
MKRKYLAGILLLFMMSLVFMAGCGTGQTGGATSNGAAPKADNNTAAKPPETPKSKDQVVNVFTARHYDVDSVIFDTFTKQTGIKINEVKGTAEELVERLKREGQGSEADLFITVDGGVLNYAKQNNVLQAVQSAEIDKNVPKQWRDKDNNWIGIATRARVIVYAKDRVKPEQLSTYDDLASDKWKGKVLVRSSSSLYNQSLVASFVELNGEAKAQEWANGIVKNLAR